MNGTLMSLDEDQKHLIGEDLFGYAIVKDELFLAIKSQTMKTYSIYVIEISRTESLSSL
jgi:hypothetical protein